LSVEEISVQRYRCVCPLPNCPGNGKSWISMADKVPKVCPQCKRLAQVIAKEVTVQRYRCVCPLPNCPGNGKSWISKADKVPPRCKWCHRYSWNGQDKRSPVRPKVINAALARGATTITITSTDASGKQVSAPLVIHLPAKKDNAAARRTAIVLPKPKRVRSIE
jgi:hypothetical protein